MRRPIAIVAIAIGIGGCSLFLDTSGLNENQKAAPEGGASDGSLASGDGNVITITDPPPAAVDGGSDADAGPLPHGCIATNPGMSRLLCEEFDGDAVPGGWTQGLSPGGTLTPSGAAFVSPSHALFSETPAGLDNVYARLFRTYSAATYSRALLDFDLRVEAGEPFAVGLALASCNYFVVASDQRVFLYTNAYDDERTAEYNDTTLFRHGTWRHVQLDVTGTRAALGVDGTKLTELAANVQCEQSGSLDLTIGVFFKAGSAMYLDNVSLDAVTP